MPRLQRHVIPHPSPDLARSQKVRVTGSKLDWESSLVWFPCPEGCGGLIRATKGTVSGHIPPSGLAADYRFATTAQVDRTDFEAHMAKNHGKAAA